MRQSFPALILAIATASSLMPAMAEEAAEMPVASVSLGQIDTFEVHDIEPFGFSTLRESVPPEIVEYARNALQSDGRLEYASPGEGVLRFECADESCSRVSAELKHGENGPVLWRQEYQWQRSYFSLREPDGKKFARNVVDHLARDYQKASKIIPVSHNPQHKIEIPEE